jgi:hypothetical protein
MHGCSSIRWSIVTILKASGGASSFQGKMQGTEVWGQTGNSGTQDLFTPRSCAARSPDGPYPKSLRMRLLTSPTKELVTGLISTIRAKQVRRGSVALAAQNRGNIMINIKFVVRVSHTGTRAPAYVQRIEKTSFQMTTDRKLALIMGKFAAEDAAKSLQNSRCTPEILPVNVSA